MSAKTAVVGAGGRMGGRIISLLKEAEGLSLSGALEASGHPLIGRDVGEHLGLGILGVKISDDPMSVLKNSQVVIDFTLPEATLKLLAAAEKQKTAAVVGTTGISPEGKHKIGTLAKHIPIVMAPNMSMGVNVMFYLAGEIARILGPDYDLEVIEAHHRMKKDAPSGTALRLGEILAEARQSTLDKVGRFDRHGIIGARSAEEIGMQTIRAGDIVGEHTVIYGGVGERLEFTHRAHSRDNFALGALRAARWVVKQPPGLYDMQDVLGLRK